MSLPAEKIATLRIELIDTDPPIWRQVEVPTSITLKGLHDVVQAAMGWDDQHLWELRLGKQRYGQPFPGDDWGGPPTVRADKVRLHEVLKPRKTVAATTSPTKLRPSFEPPWRIRPGRGRNSRSSVIAKPRDVQIYL